MSRLEQARELSKILREFLEDKGWADRELARRSGVHPSSISDYLQGITLAGKENREKLAEAMGLVPDELDAKLGIAVAKPKRKVEELCRDIRLLDDEEFAEVAEVVYERSLRKLREGKKRDRRRNR